MHIWTNIQAGSAAVEESSMLISATGAGGGGLQHPVWKKYEISLQRKSMEFLFQSHYLADISMKKLCHQSIAYITMEWRGQQHAREAVESTASSATSTIQEGLGTPQLGSDEEEEDGRVSYRIDQGKLIKASKEELTFPIDYKS